MTTNSAVAYSADPVATNARTVLSLLLIAAVGLVADAVVGLRSIEVGSDTDVYADLFLSMRHALVVTRLEPGFLLLTRALSATGMSVAAYQAVLFALSLLAAGVAARRYFHHLGGTRGYLTFFSAALMFLFLSPMFVNASTNAVRQGMVALLVFAALLSFQHRQWRSFILFGAVASSFHYSSLLYLAFAPLLLLNLRLQRIIAITGFLAYCTGLTMILVRILAPSVFVDVMTYQLGATYRSGVRIDFAVFSLFWYLLPYLGSRLVREPFSTRIKQSTSVYRVMVLPFFVLGWGNYSNRLLLAPWVAVSLVVAAMFFNARTPILRHPLLLRGGLVIASGVFCYYVTHRIMV